MSEGQKETGTGVPTGENELPGERKIREAEERLLAHDYLGAMASLESAWHLRPDDPAIREMQHRIQIAQRAETDRQLEAKLQEASDLLSAGKEEEAFSLAQQILAEDPTHKGAKLLGNQILESRWQQVQEQITAGLELAIQPLAFCDFEVSSNLLYKLQQNLEIDACRKEIERLRSAVITLQTAFESEQLYDVSPIIKQLFFKDPFGWLEPHRSVFTGVETIASERQEQRQTQIRSVLLESKQLFEGGAYFQAIAKLDLLLKEGNVPEARELKEQIISEYVAFKQEEATRYAAVLEWEQAIISWKELLAILPDSIEIEERVNSAEKHIAKELQIQKTMLQELKRCYSLVLKEEWIAAQELTESMLNEIQPGFRLIEIETEIEKLQSVILIHNSATQKECEATAKQLNQARKLYKKGLYAEALGKLEAILETEYLQDEALDLKIAVEKTIFAQSVSDRFQSAVQKGKEFFEKQDWQRAIEFWKKACLLSDEPYVKEWIGQAEQNLKKERHIRLSILAMLAEVEELIHYQRLPEAEQKLDKCQNALSDEVSFEDLVSKVEKLTEKLKIEKEREIAIRARIQSELEEASLFYHQRLYGKAQAKVEEILEQQPELEAAIELKTQIETAEAANISVLEILRAAVKLVVKRDTKLLPKLLLRLKESADSTPYAEDCQSIIDEIPLLVLEIESGDQPAAMERLDRMFRRSVLMLEYEQILRDFVGSLQSRIRKEAALEENLAKGLHLLETGNRREALECIQRFHSIFLGKKKGTPKHLERTAALSDDDLKLTEIELKSLHESLLRHEVDTLVREAQKRLSMGDKENARELLLQVLRVDPANIAALGALQDLQND